MQSEIALTKAHNATLLDHYHVAHAGTPVLTSPFTNMIPIINCCLIACKKHPMLCLLNLS